MGYGEEVQPIAVFGRVHLWKKTILKCGFNSGGDEVRRPHLLSQTPIPMSMQGLGSSHNPWTDLVRHLSPPWTSLMWKHPICCHSYTALSPFLSFLLRIYKKTRVRRPWSSWAPPSSLHDKFTSQTWLPNSHTANSSSCASLAGLLSRWLAADFFFRGTHLPPLLVAPRVFFCARYRWIHIIDNRELCWWIKTRPGWGRRRPTAATGAISAPHAQRCRTRRRRPGRGWGMAVRCPSTSTPITSHWGGSAGATIACTTLD